MPKRDFYDVLGVARSATSDQIRTAYRKLARKFHPDVNKAADAAAKFREATEAYEVLSNPRTRAEYDRELDGYASSQYYGSTTRTPPPPQWPRPNAVLSTMSPTSAPPR